MKCAKGTSQSSFVRYDLKYSLNTLWFLSIPPTVSWWCDVDKLWVTPSNSHKSLITLFYNSDPWSVLIVRIGPCLSINCSNIILATMFASLFSYRFPWFVCGRGPTVSIIISSNGFSGVFVIVISSLMSCFGFFNVQCTYIECVHRLSLSIPYHQCHTNRLFKFQHTSAM